MEDNVMKRVPIKVMGHTICGSVSSKGKLISKSDLLAKLSKDLAANTTNPDVVTYISMLIEQLSEL